MDERHVREWLRAMTTGGFVDYDPTVAGGLAAALPDARCVELEGSGHVTYAEKPDDLPVRSWHSPRAGPAHACQIELGGTVNPSVPPDDNASRFDVHSADGTPLAVWVDGRGPALVMVHGSFADHTTFEPFVGVLRGGLTTFSMDRRGFGASGDTAEYAVEREFEDVAAVVDAVAARTGGPVTLWGHSYGANCAMGGAALTKNVHHLVLYEPSLGVPYPPGSIEAIEEALAADDREAAIVAVLVGVLEMTGEEIDAMRSTPLWPVRLASAHTVPRECRVEEGWVYQSGRFDGISAPTLLLAGSESVRALVDAAQRAAAAIPDIQNQVLEGHGHFAHKTDPAMVAAVVRQFISL